MSSSLHKLNNIVGLFIMASVALCVLPMGHPAAGAGSPGTDDEIAIDLLPPDRRGGKAYKLVYRVKVPLEVYWNFKTDFDNDFLVDNKYILRHHFISKDGNIVITEDAYTTDPDIIFRWQTIVIPEAYRLDFTLINPNSCGQRFHYGHIQMEAVEEGTRVTQVAYFDFLGAALWAGYPWGGGMRDFLSYTARWEQEMAFRLKDRYSVKPTE